MKEILKELGVHAGLLSEEEKTFLDKNGYLVLENILTLEQVDAINDKLAALLMLEGANAGFELMESKYIRHPKEAGADRLADLVNKDPIFDIFYTHPRVLAGIAHVLGTEIKLSSLNYRAAKPGAGLQKLHADWHEPVAPGDYKVCNSIWLLDDFSPANGATRIVPGAHLEGKLPQDVLEDPWKPHPNEVILTAPAGTVAIFNSHAWHGGTTNHTGRDRRSIHSYFCRRDQPQQIDQMKYIRPETRTRLSAAAQRMLGV
jgi:ectoine hydroxylase-related dioxygenase (phytanoyl-CoA dioxygenase family)